MHIARTAVYALALLAVASTALQAQPVRISGTVVDAGLRPIQGATVRLTGADTTITTPVNGSFLFEGIFPSGMILTVSAPGYQFRSIPLSPGSTALTVTLSSRIASLDTMFVRPKVRIKGTVRDSASRDALLFAQVRLYPPGRRVDASNIGNFTFDTVAMGPVTIVAEAVEHLPVAVQFEARRDTSITLRLPVDSVAVRMIAQQAVRLARRSQSTPLPVRQFGRKDIAREARGTVGELIDRLNLSKPGRRARNMQSAEEACVFYDDRKIAPGMLDGMYPELVERVEIYRRGAMIRVYSKAYVFSLMAQDQLRGIKYIRSGLGVVCD